MTITDLTPSSAPVTLASQQIPLTLTAESPIHHGAGTAGNTALLRTQEVVLPDGTQAAVPFVSGNSVRHAIRDALAWRLARVLDIAAGSLPKGVVDLLWSGGALTRTGSQVELEQARKLAVIPALGLLGYSAQSDIVTGSLRANNLNLVCAENDWRLPSHLGDHPHARLHAGRFRGEEFGTRHDVTGTGVDVLVESSGMFGVPQSTQMIYEHQVLLPGSVLWGRLCLDAATPLATDALHTALVDLAPDGVMWIGAKRGSGYGACRLDLHGVELDRVAPARHDEHLRARRDDILAALTAAVS